ncbi:MAG: hypothetical protein K2Q34_06790 [Alphaproteobacteria bacterium]|nr:hypothetical protein [Alphaproteobacteria bacterium]
MHILKLKFTVLEKSKKFFKKLASFKKQSSALQDVSGASEFECKVCFQEGNYFLILDSQLTPIRSKDAIQHENFYIQFDLEESPSLKTYDHILPKESLETLSYPESNLAPENDPLAFLYSNFNFKTASLPFPNTRLLSNQKEEVYKKTIRNNPVETFKPPNKGAKRKTPVR